MESTDDRPLTRLRKALRGNRGKNLCRVGTQDRVLIESQLERTDKIQIDLPSPRDTPEGSFLNFDGVWLVEDPSLPLGEFRFDSHGAGKQS